MLLDQLQQKPGKSFIEKKKKQLTNEIVKPFQNIFDDVAKKLPNIIQNFLETKHRTFVQLLDNDWKKNSFSYYWGCFYPKGKQRDKEGQLAVFLDQKGLHYGLYIPKAAGSASSLFFTI